MKVIYPHSKINKMENSEMQDRIDEMMEENNVPITGYFFYAEPQIFVNIRYATKKLKEDWDNLSKEIKISNQREFENHT